MLKCSQDRHSQSPGVTTTMSRSIVASTVFPNFHRSISLAILFERLFALLAPISLLLAGLYINKKIDTRFPLLWLSIPIFLATVMASARYIEDEKPVVRLWQLVGCLSAVYIFFHYPLLPPKSDDSAVVALYGFMLFIWLVSLAAGAICFKIPSFSVLPPSFLLWSNSVASTVTGLPVTAYTDVYPLPEISICIAIGLLINQIYSRSQNTLANEVFDDKSQPAPAALLRKEFAKLLCLFAISIHLANYFFSFYAKVTFPGPLLAWPWENNPAYIFLTALDDGHILFLANQQLVEFTFAALDRLHIISNFGILFVQGAALTAFFLPKRALIILLLLFDLMHASIILIVGANFWPWILLNGVIIYVVSSHDFPEGVIICASDEGPHASAINLVLRLLATGFIIVAPCFFTVAWLGWYDSGANNKLFFEAVDDLGARHYVPTNYFTFYSYSLAHMDYGTPEPETAFATGEPNGGAFNYGLFKAGVTCDLNVLRHPHAYDWSYQEKLTAFVRNYHRTALRISSIIGDLPYNVYAHHFHIPGILTKDFDQLDKRRIVAYIYRRESVCLSFGSGWLQRKVRAVAEYRIDIGQEGNNEGVGK